jgi:hypothetical protein
MKISIRWLRPGCGDTVGVEDGPSQYERYLKGAVVEAHIALTSWVFTTRNPKAMTVPIVREILVILPPKPLVASPMKGKNIRDGPLTSPKKKGQT